MQASCLIHLLFFSSVALFFMDTAHGSAKEPSPNTEKNSPPFIIPSSIPDIDPDYKNNWIPLTGFEYSGLHWNQFIAIYTNKGEAIYRHNFYEYIKAYHESDGEYDPAFKTYSTGTVLLKENYLDRKGKPGKPTTLTIMIKRKEGFDKKNGNWEFIEVDAQGEVIFQGKPETSNMSSPCIKCHQKIKERDYIFSTFFTEQKQQSSDTTIRRYSH